MDVIVQQQIDRIKEDCEKIKPLVVIRCITYNQEAYIRDALEGFVNQKTNFPFVAIVHDDASDDQTVSIIQEYTVKYPNIIMPIFESKNQCSKRDGSLGRIIKAACDATNAKYIAMCEGDDYWINPLKLQKQVDFLEAHPDYTLCFHRVKVEVEKGMPLGRDIYEHLKEKEYNLEELLAQLTVPTCAAVLRKDMFTKRPVNPQFQYGDNVLWLTCLKEGKIYCLGEEMGVYRRHAGSWTTGDAYSASIKQVTHFKALMISFDLADNNLINNKLSYYLAKSFLLGLKKGKRDAIKYLNEGYKRYKWHYVYSIFEALKIYFHNNFTKK